MSASEFAKRVENLGFAKALNSLDFKMCSIEGGSEFDFVPPSHGSFLRYIKQLEHNLSLAPALHQFVAYEAQLRAKHSHGFPTPRRMYFTSEPVHDSSGKLILSYRSFFRVYWGEYLMIEFRDGEVEGKFGGSAGTTFNRSRWAWIPFEALHAVWVDQKTNGQL